MNALDKNVCSRLLFGIYASKEYAEMWWSRSNPNFGGKTPDEIWVHSPQRIFDYIMSMYYD